MVDMGLPVAPVDRVRRRQFGNRHTVNPIEPTRVATGGVTKEDVFAVTLRFSTALDIREVRRDLEELRGVASVGE